MNERSGGILGLIALAAAFFVLKKFFPALARLFMILGGIAAVGVVLLVAAVIFFAFRKPKKTEQQQMDEYAVATIQKGRVQLMDIRRLAMRIKNPDIRKSSENICAQIEKILRTLKEQPGDVPRLGRFFSYYLPTLHSILTKYTRLEATGLPGQDTAEKTLSCLKDMESAMEKQYQNLFEDEKLDLTVEMKVMSQICKRDGLLADDCQIPDIPVYETRPSRETTPSRSAAEETQETEQGITLTL